MLSPIDMWSLSSPEYQTSFNERTLVPLTFMMVFSYSLSVIPMAPASSASEAVRPSFAASSTMVSSISRDFCRTERGTQSSSRSSSKIAPRMRVTAYVLNLTFLSGSNLLIASSKPNCPNPTKSSNSTLSGMPVETFPATYFTNGIYCLMNLSRSAGDFVFLNSCQSSSSVFSSVSEVPILHTLFYKATHLFSRASVLPSPWFLHHGSLHWIRLEILRCCFSYAVQQQQNRCLESLPYLPFLPSKNRNLYLRCQEAHLYLLLQQRCRSGNLSPEHLRLLRELYRCSLQKELLLWQKTAALNLYSEIP